MKPLALLTLAVLASIMVPAAADAASRTEKVYGPNGRRVAVVKRTAFGTKIYGENGQRVATIKGGR